MMVVDINALPDTVTENCKWNTQRNGTDTKSCARVFGVDAMERGVIARSAGTARLNTSRGIRRAGTALLNVAMP